MGTGNNRPVGQAREPGTGSGAERKRKDAERSRPKRGSDGRFTAKSETNAGEEQKEAQTAIPTEAQKDGAETGNTARTPPLATPPALEVTQEPPPNPPITVSSEQPEAPPKRKRGRPRKTTPTGEPMAVGSKPRRTRKSAAEKQHETESKQIASTFIDMFNVLAVAQVGPAGEFTAHERDMIEPALQRTLTRLSPSASERASVFLDPVMIIFGLGIWYLRVGPLMRPQHVPGIPPQDDAAVNENTAKDTTMNGYQPAVDGEYVPPSADSNVLEMLGAWEP